MFKIRAELARKHKIVNLTSEQESIINSSGSIRINAVAGSGKTTTLIEYARTRPSNSSILYLAFNKSVKDEAISKFEKAGLRNVRVETAHSLAFRAIVLRNNYQVGFHSPYSVAKFLFSTDMPTADHAVFATHVLNFSAFFCNSKAKKVTELNYRETISKSEKEQVAFVENYYSDIEMYTRKYLAAMYKGALDITHDFYLKLFSLNPPKLHYNYILFDEAQDASSVMVEIVKAQDAATKVIVGDSHQQIYRWRYAVNSMELFDFPQYRLSISFRLTEPFADLAKSILRIKREFQKIENVEIIGYSKAKTPINSRATIARTNISLLAEAIAFVAKKRKDTPIYFEGHIKAYLFGDDGGSLSDVLNLHLNKREYIRNEIIASLPNIDELSEFAEKSGDTPMLRVIDLVKKYGDKLPIHLAKLHKCHVEKENRENAEMVFSTVHRCKGMEYDEVTLCPDFMSEKQITYSIKPKDDGTTRSTAAELGEEVNLLYVAVTRAKKRLIFPKSLIPSSVNGLDSSYIKVIALNDSLDKLDNLNSPNRRGGNTLKKIASGSYWSNDDEDYLIREFNKKSKIKDIAVKLKRSRGAISSRLKKLNEQGRL